MNTSDFATWSQIISSAAVVVTLVYLSIQTRQTSKLLRSEARQALIQVDMEILNNQVQFPELTMSWDSDEEPTLEQKHRLWSFLCAFMRSREHQFLQFQIGVLDQAAWVAYQSAIPVVIGSDRCRAWWKRFGAPLYDPGFVKTVDTLLAANPKSNLNQQISKWK